MADQNGKQLVRQIEPQDLKKPENVVIGVKDNVITIGDDSWGKCANESSDHKQSVRPIETQDLRNPENVVIGFKDNVRHNKYTTHGDDAWGRYAA
jgi:hypothetical protein